MMTRPERPHTFQPSRSFITVAVVSRSPDLSAIDTVLGAGDRGVIFVDSMATAYSQIKRMTPDLIVMCLSDDDPDGCQVLSMLALDGDTARIPVLTCTTPSSDGRADDASDSAIDLFRRYVPLSLN